MEHIIQITDNNTYIVVIENGEQALIDFPDLFEKVNCEIPANAQYLIYSNEDIS
jgi:hypothetical protein